MRRIFRFLVPAMALVLFSSGCGRLELLRTKELRELQAETEAMKLEITKMHSAMGSGFSEQLQNVKEQEEALARMKADLQALVSRLERQLALVEGSMEESRSRLDKIVQKTEQIDSKEYVIKGAFASGAAADTSGGASAPRIVVKEKTEVDKLYQLAYQDFQSRKFDMAREGFEELIRNNPQSDLADNAQYWIAECYYAKKDYRKAVEEYTKVLKNYPNANKAPSAMYKLGLALEKANDTQGRDRVWEELLKKYPASDEAALVKSKLVDTATTEQ